jgi:hypothetical protein
MTNGLESKSARGEPNNSSSSTIETESIASSAPVTAREEVEATETDSSVEVVAKEVTTAQQVVTNKKPPPAAATTMLERQNLWMAQKEEKERARKSLAEQSLVNSITSQPDTKASRKSFSVVQRSSVEAASVGLADLAAQAIADVQKQVFAKERKAEAKIAAANSRAAANAKKQQADKAMKELSAAEKYDLLMNPKEKDGGQQVRKERTSLTKRGSIKVKKATTKATSTAAAPPQLAIVEPTVEDAAVNALLGVEFSPVVNSDSQRHVRRNSASDVGGGAESFRLRGRGRRGTESAAAEQAAPGLNVEVAEDGAGCLLGGGPDMPPPPSPAMSGPPSGLGTPPFSPSSSSERERKAKNSASIEKTSFVPGQFFTRVDENSDKGHYKVRDGSAFALSTMYRKRDKYSKKGSAVALLVGKDNNGLGEEKVIEILFDRSSMGGEEQCAAWWKENEMRFSTPRREEDGGIRGDDGWVRKPVVVKDEK